MHRSSVSLVLIAVALIGCQIPAPVPPRAAEKLAAREQLSGGAIVVNELELQALVMSMADDYYSDLAELAFQLTKDEDTTTRERWLAKSWLRNGMGASIDIAAGPNPDVALLDLLVLVSLQRAVFERYWIPQVWGEARGRPVFERLKGLEAKLWESGGSLLDEAQQATLRGLIDSWLERPENQDRFVVEFVRFQEFADDRNVQNLRAAQQARGLLREVNEAVRAVDDARLLGERALWYAGRAMFVAGQQTELTVYRMLDQPEVAELRDRLDGLGETAVRLVEAIRQLPEQVAIERVAALQDLEDRVAAQRELAIDRFFERFDAERTILLDDVASRGDELAAILDDVRQTTRAATDLAAALTTTVAGLDRVVGRFDSDPAAGPGREPLDLRVVRDAAIETAAAAERLTALLQETNALLDSPNLDARIDRLDGTAASIADRFFWRALILVLVLVAGLAGVRLIPSRAPRR